MTAEQIANECWEKTRFGVSHSTFLKVVREALLSFTSSESRELVEALEKCLAKMQSPYLDGPSTKLKGVVEAALANHRAKYPKENP